MIVRNPSGRIVEVPESMWSTLKDQGFEIVESAPTPDTFTGPTLSIIVLAWNRVEQTRACLASLLSCTKVDFELIVVDNASSDETPAFLKELAASDHRVRIVTNATNRGVAGGRNDGIREARGRFLAFFDNDSTVGEGWDRIMLEVFGRHPHAGFVGHNGTNMHDFTQKGMRNVAPLTSAEIRVDLVSGGATMIRREVFDEAGLLDEWGMGEFWHEDAEICLRAARSGWESYCVHFPWLHAAHSSYKAEKGSEWMEAFQKNLTYIKQKLSRRNEVRILLNRDTYERDLYEYGRAFAQFLTRKGKMCTLGFLPPIIPSSVRRSVPFVIEAHGRRHWYVAAKNTEIPATWPLFFTDEADTVIAPSEQSRSVLADMGVPVELIEPGVDHAVFHSDATPTVLLPPGMFVFMHRGSSKIRGTDLAIRAFFEEFDREPVMLAIKTETVSDMQLLKTIEETQKETGSSARFLVYSEEWDQRRTAAFLRRANAALQPSRFDTDAIKVNEARACHTPVISLSYAATKGLKIDHKVAYELEPSGYLNNPAEPFYTMGESPQWAEPSLEDLRRAMREAYEAKDHAHPGTIPEREESFEHLLTLIS